MKLGPASRGFVHIRALTQEERDMINVSGLRSLVLGTDPLASQEGMAALGGVSPEDVEVITDEPAEFEGGYHGNHNVFAPAGRECGHRRPDRPPRLDEHPPLPVRRELRRKPWLLREQQRRHQGHRRVVDDRRIEREVATPPGRAGHGRPERPAPPARAADGAPRPRPSRRRRAAATKAPPARPWPRTPAAARILAAARRHGPARRWERQRRVWRQRRQRRALVAASRPPGPRPARQRVGGPWPRPARRCPVGPQQVPADRPAVLVLRVVGGVRPQPVQHLRRRSTRPSATSGGCSPCSASSWSARSITSSPSGRPGTTPSGRTACSAGSRSAPAA